MSVSKSSALYEGLPLESSYKNSERQREIPVLAPEALVDLSLKVPKNCPSSDWAL